MGDIRGWSTFASIFLLENCFTLVARREPEMRGVFQGRFFREVFRETPQDQLTKKISWLSGIHSILDTTVLIPKRA